MFLFIHSYIGVLLAQPATAEINSNEGVVDVWKGREETFQKGGVENSPVEGGRYGFGDSFSDVRDELIPLFFLKSM